MWNWNTHRIRESGKLDPHFIMIAIASVYIDEEVLNRHLLPSIPEGITERHFILGTKPSNIAAIYNDVLAHTEAQQVIFAHPDVSFSGEVCEALVGALKGDVGVTGLVGSRGPGCEVWANRIRVETEVASLDSCILAVDRSHGILFDDKTFSELHLYGEDYCYEARSRGLRCLVMPVKDFKHASVTFSQQGPGWGRYQDFRKCLVSKWKDRFGRAIYTT